MHQNNSEEEQNWMESIRQNSSSVQEKQPYFRQSQYTSRTNNIEGEWGHDHYSNPNGCSLLLYTINLSFQKKNPKKRTRKNHRKYQRQVKSLFRPQNQI